MTAVICFASWNDLVLQQKIKERFQNDMQEKREDRKQPHPSYQESIPVTERGKTDITVYASDLTAGMYIYTLVVDGKVAMTRRLIVTM